MNNFCTIIFKIFKIFLTTNSNEKHILGIYVVTDIRIMSTLKDFSLIFDENNAKRVVPSKWLFDNKTKLKWPVMKSNEEIVKLIKKLGEPKDDWETYPITRHVKSCDDYAKATTLINIKGFENVSDLSDEEKIKKSRALRKRKSFLTDKDNETPKNRKTYPSFYETQVDTEHDNDNSIENDNCSNGETNTTEKNTPILNQESSVLDTLNAGNQSASTSQAVPSISSNQVFEALNLLREGQQVILKNQNVLLLRFDNLEKTFKSANYNRSSAIGNDANRSLLNTFNYFPVDEEKILMQDIENKLKTDKSFFSNVIAFMKSKGGATYHDLIYNILAAVLKDKAACAYSFFGQKSKKPFNELILCNCIYQATNASFNGVTDDQIKNSLKKWLDASSTRTKRSENRAYKKNTIHSFTVNPGRIEC